MIADFVLIPYDQISFAKILEIKLPKLRLSKKQRNPHSAMLLNSLDQLRSYYNDLNEAENIEEFKKRYGVEVYKPEIQLLAGRNSDIHDLKAFKTLQKTYNAKITTYDMIVSDYKRRYKIK